MTEQPSRPGDASASSSRSALNPGGVLPPPPPPPGYAPYPPPSPQRGQTILGRVSTALISTVLLGSIALNVYFAILFGASLDRGPTETVYEAGDTKHRIVIVPVQGLIDDDTFRGIRDSLRALKDKPPRAVVLRVDSGGGYVAPSDRIWHAIDQFKRETGLPLVASFGSMAASGGYYVAAPADYIVAEPTTLTGSIGVIAQAFTVEELLAKVGIKPEVIASTGSTQKDMLNPLRSWTEEDRNKLRIILDNSYERFVQVVHQGRADKLSEEEVRRVATGDVFTAGQAIENKLVDSEGYLDAAIAKAVELAAIPSNVKPHVTVIAPRRPFSLIALMRSQSSLDVGSLSPAKVNSWLLEAGTPRLMYREPMLTYQP